MDIYTYWLDAIFGRSETEEQRDKRMKDWYEHLWATL